MISAVLLGAGEGRRMGADKLSLPWGNQTILERSLETLMRSRIDEVIVVVHRDPGNWKNDLRGKRVRFVLNPEYRRGMSTSIRKGILKVDPSSRGILIALGDQPFLKPRTINALIRAFSEGKGTIVIPAYRGKRGNPVLFDRCHKKELLQLEGDVGGKSIIETHPGRIVELRTRSPAVIRDIDTWKDYRKACKMKVKTMRRNHSFH